MDHRRWIKEWEETEGPFTWAGYEAVEPDEDPGLVKPFRRPVGMGDAQWREALGENARLWTVSLHPLMRAIVLVNESRLWCECGRSSCRRHRRCGGWAAEGAFVPDCCADGERYRTVMAALFARDRLTEAFRSPPGAEEGTA